MDAQNGSSLLKACFKVIEGLVIIFSVAVIIAQRLFRAGCSQALFAEDTAALFINRFDVLLASTIVTTGHFYILQAESRPGPLSSGSILFENLQGAIENNLRFIELTFQFECLSKEIEIRCKAELGEWFYPVV